MIVFYCHIGDDIPLPNDIPVTVHYKLILLEYVETDYITCSLSSVDSFTRLKESEELTNYLALIYFAKLSLLFS